MRRRKNSPPTSNAERSVDPTELSDEELEHVAGGLERAWTERTSSRPDDGRLGEGRRSAPDSAEGMRGPPAS